MALYDKMIKAIKKEIIIRSKNYNDEIQTIYYGGGTPSLLKIKDINDIKGTQKIFNHRAKMNTLATQGKWSKDLEI